MTIRSDSERDTLTVEEVAERLRCNRNTAYALVASGAIPSVRVGRLIRIPVAGYEDYLAGG